MVRDFEVGEVKVPRGIRGNNNYLGGEEGFSGWERPNLSSNSNNIIRIGDRTKEAVKLNMGVRPTESRR